MYGQTLKIDKDSDTFRLLMSEDFGADLQDFLPAQEPARKPHQNPPGSRGTRQRRKKERQNRRRGRKGS